MKLTIRSRIAALLGAAIFGTVLSPLPCQAKGFDIFHGLFHTYYSKTTTKTVVHGHPPAALQAPVAPMAAPVAQPSFAPVMAAPVAPVYYAPVFMAPSAPTFSAPTAPSFAPPVAPNYAPPVSQAPPAAPAAPTPQASGQR